MAGIAFNCKELLQLNFERKPPNFFFSRDKSVDDVIMMCLMT